MKEINKNIEIEEINKNIEIEEIIEKVKDNNENDENDEIEDLIMIDENNKKEIIQHNIYKFI